MGSKGKGRRDARALLDAMIGEPLSFGSMMTTIRETDGFTLEALARRLGVSRSHLCDIEKGRRGVSIERAAKWAKALGYDPALFVQLAVQEAADAAGLGLRIDVRAKSAA